MLALELVWRKLVRLNSVMKGLNIWRTVGQTGPILNSIYNNDHLI